jgi:hypothetical protein
MTLEVQLGMVMLLCTTTTTVPWLMPDVVGGSA